MHLSTYRDYPDPVATVEGVPGTTVREWATPDIERDGHLLLLAGSAPRPYSNLTLTRTATATHARPVASAVAVEVDPASTPAVSVYVRDADACCEACPPTTEVDPQTWRSCRCAPGFDDYGSGGAGRCTPCAAGFARPRGAAACEPCPAGSFASPDGTECVLCPQGTASLFAGAASNASCVPCGGGGGDAQGLADGQAPTRLVATEVGPGTCDQDLFTGYVDRISVSVRSSPGSGPAVTAGEFKRCGAQGRARPCVIRKCVWLCTPRANMHQRGVVKSPRCLRSEGHGIWRGRLHVHVQECMRQTGLGRLGIVATEGPGPERTDPPSPQTFLPPV